MEIVAFVANYDETNCTVYNAEGCALEGNDMVDEHTGGGFLCYDTGRVRPAGRSSWRDAPWPQHCEVQQRLS